MRNHILSLLYDHWDSLRAGRLAPFRAEINPRAFSPALEHMFILETLGPDDIRIRLAGRRLCEMMGMEVRGKPAVSMMRADSRAQLARIMRQVTSTPSIAEITLRAHDFSNAEFDASMILLPLRSDFGTIDRIIGAISLEATRFGPPLGFSILSANIHAVKEGIIDAPALPGFAEAQGGFSMGGAPDLRAVADNPNAARGTPRGQFRVIKGGQD